MSFQENHYFKFVTALIDSGIWAELSASARTLYPVLLRFSDRNYKPVFPGSKTLLKLTGFKQKSSIRKARQELIEKGLVFCSSGTGRKNTQYHFRFDWIAGGRGNTPHDGTTTTPWVSETAPSGETSEVPPYNQIHISINNNVHKALDSTPVTGLPSILSENYSPQEIELAKSECLLAGIEPTSENLKNLLYRKGNNHESFWNGLKKTLSTKISPGSFQMIHDAFIAESGDILIFSERLPDHLKKILSDICPKIFFEPELKLPENRHQFWEKVKTTI